MVGSLSHQRKTDEVSLGSAFCESLEVDAVEETAKAACIVEGESKFEADRKGRTFKRKHLDHKGETMQQRPNSSWPS